VAAGAGLQRHVERHAPGSTPDSRFLHETISVDGQVVGHVSHDRDGCTGDLEAPQRGLDLLAQLR